MTMKLVLHVLFLACAARAADPDYSLWGKKPTATDAKLTYDGMFKVLKSFRTEQMGGDCIDYFDRHGFFGPLRFKDEEGRMAPPPRSGFEAELYKRLKNYLKEHGRNPANRISNEELFRMGLESCRDQNGRVNIQDVFVTLINVTRLLARSENWANVAGGHTGWDLGYFQFIPNFFGYDPKLGGHSEMEIAYRGMVNDPIFPIIKDIGGIESIDGADTLPDICKGKTGTPFRKTKEQRDAIDKKNAPEVAALKAEISRITTDLENQRVLLETQCNEAHCDIWSSVKRRRRGREDGDIGKDCPHVPEYMKLKTAADDRLLALNARLNDLVNNPNIYLNAGSTYVSKVFFDPDDGVFETMVGALDPQGNGGCYYYFWTGAVAQSTPGGTVFTTGARPYEMWQKWKWGSLDEFLGGGELPRGLVQITHFEVGRTLALNMWLNNLLCWPEPKTEEAPEAFVSAWKNLRDWYCTNRPVIQSVLDVPNLVIRIANGSILNSPGTTR